MKIFFAFLPWSPFLLVWTWTEKKFGKTGKKGNFTVFGAPEVFKDPKKWKPTKFSVTPPENWVKQIFRHGIFLCHVHFHVVVLSPNLAWDAGEDGPNDQDIRNFVAKWQWGLPSSVASFPLRKMLGLKRRNDRKIGFAKISWRWKDVYCHT